MGLMRAAFFLYYCNSALTLRFTLEIARSQSVDLTTLIAVCVCALIAALITTLAPFVIQACHDFLICFISRRWSLPVVGDFPLLVQAILLLFLPFPFFLLPFPFPFSFSSFQFYSVFIFGIGVLCLRLVPISIEHYPRRLPLRAAARVFSQMTFCRSDHISSRNQLLFPWSCASIPIA